MVMGFRARLASKAVQRRRPAKRQLVKYISLFSFSVSARFAVTCIDVHDIVVPPRFRAFFLDRDMEGVELGLYFLAEKPLRPENASHG